MSGFEPGSPVPEVDAMSTAARRQSCLENFLKQKKKNFA
jgi:hypothetical protein